MHPEKDALRAYLARGRDKLVWKLDGLGEYDVRRPLVPTGTNLLGLVKHLAGVEAEYLGVCFGRPFPEPIPWLREDAEPDEDMWATSEEDRADLLDLYRRVWAHGEATIEALDLGTVGEVPWWPEERRHPTLATVLVHVIAEVHQHAGHADLVRELVDGATGFLPHAADQPDGDDDRWRAHRERVERAAREAAGRG